MYKCIKCAIHFKETSNENNQFKNNSLYESDNAFIR